MVKFTAHLERRAHTNSIHIALSDYVDYAELNNIIESALMRASLGGSDADVASDWERCFYDQYLQQIQKVKRVLRRISRLPTAELPPHNVFQEYVTLNKQGFDKIAKKFDKARAFNSIQQKMQKNKDKMPMHLKDNTNNKGKVPLQQQVVLQNAYLRNENATLYSVELAPLAAECLSAGYGIGSGVAGSGLDTVGLLRGVFALLVLIFCVLWAGLQHTTRVEHMVIMPWHAAAALAMGWPAILLAWAAGTSGMAPRDWFELLGCVVCCGVTSVALAGSEPPPFPVSPSGWAWWIFLATVSFANVRLLLGIWGRNLFPGVVSGEAQRNAQYRRELLLCSAAYVGGCFVRSLWPRIDVERICFFDSFLSVTFVGRLLATVAELSFSRQLALVLGRLTDDLRSDEIARLNTRLAPAWMTNTSSLVARLIVPLIAVAQTCCWCGVTTTRQIWHGVEESIWALTVAAMTPCAMLVAHQCWSVQQHPDMLEEEDQNYMVVHGGGCGVVGMPLACKNYFSLANGLNRGIKFGLAFAVFGPAFVAFMVYVDVPMYIARWRADELRGGKYLTLRDGIIDTLSCKEVSRDWSVWREDVPWMSAYFSICVWFSVWMAWAAPVLVLDEGKRKGD